MEQEKRCGQCGIGTAIDVCRGQTQNAAGNNKDKQSIQEVQNEIEDVIAPHLLARPNRIPRESLEEKSTRIKRETEIAEANRRIPLDGLEIVKNEWHPERIGVCGESRGK